MKKRVQHILLMAGLLLLTMSATYGQQSTEVYDLRVQELIEAFDGKDYKFEQKLNDPRFEYYAYIKKKFTGAAEKKIKSVENYKKAIGYEGKKRAITGFMATYAVELDNAEKEYGIPKYVISAILGLESDFGKVKGRYNPFNVYVSMYAADYRAGFAKSQLEELLIFVKKHELDVFEIESSYAGAMSHAQFVPYSLNRWFVGAELYNMGNNIASVAKYLAYFKEKTGTVEKAVLRYNPSDLYTAAILSLAEDARSMHEQKSTRGS